MRKILYTFILVYLIPLYANGTTCQNSLDSNNNVTGCVSYAGCRLVDGGTMNGKSCEPCQSGYYNNGEQTDCSSCDNYNFETMNTGKIYNQNDQSQGNIVCPWICTGGWYKSGDGCEICPTGAISPAGSDDVNDCICPTDTHLAYNNGTYSCEQCSCTQPENGSCTATYNKTTGECQTTITCDVGYYKTETSGTISCTKCPSNSTTDGDGATSISECKCYSGYYRGGTNMDECIQCTGELSCSGTGLTYSNTSNGFSCSDDWQLVPDDATNTYSCQSCSDSNAKLENGNCKCNQNYYGTIDGLNTHCEQCPNHSTTDDAGSISISACKCNIGYYDTESDTDSVSCSACPSNSTTDDAGSTGISACKCNVGYYNTKTDSVSCTKCPIGMTTVTLDSNGNPTNTTTNGATSIEHCAMLATSDFCFTNPDSTNKQLICTPLIPSSATKINDRTISTTTNSGN